MGKGRHKRRRKAKKLRGSLPANTCKPVQIASKRVPSEPPISDEPDSKVYAPLKPKPRPRSGAIAVAEPNEEESGIG